MNIRDLSERLSQQAETVARKILTNGKQQGREWVVGSIHGEAGESLKVCISGSKAGIWSDFATGESGDLIDLWRDVSGLSMAEALAEIKNYLGVRDEVWQRQPEAKPPVIPKMTVTVKAGSQVHAWLTQDRRLSERSITAYRVAENGNLVIFPFKFGERLRMVKQRNITDKKDQRPTSGKQEKSLFGWQAIPDNQRVAYIVEGELDAMAMFDYGFPALSVPYGGGSGDKQDWIENEYENLDRFEEIFLCLDMDEQGKAATAEIISRLGAERCRVVSLPAKDANQCLIDGIETAEIARAVRASAPVDPEELRQMSSLYNEVWEFRESGGEDPGFYAPWEKSEKLFKFRLDELSIHNGRNGHCKTWGVGQLSLAAAQQGFRVCIASLELKPRRLAERIEKQAAGVKGRPSKEYSRAVFDWFNDKLWIFEHTGTAKADRIIEVFTYARKRYGIRVFVIDSLMKCGFNEDDYNGQKQFVDRLCDFKNKYSCHVMLVTHSRKADSHSEFKSDTKSDIKGTGAISDLADSVFIWWKNIKKMKDLENPGDGDLSQIEMEADEFLKCEKQRNGEWEGSLALWFDECCQFVESYKGRPRQYVKYSKTEAA